MGLALFAEVLAFVFAFVLTLLFGAGMTLGIGVGLGFLLGLFMAIANGSDDSGMLFEFGALDAFLIGLVLAALLYIGWALGVVSGVLTRLRADL